MLQDVRGVATTPRRVLHRTISTMNTVATTATRTTRTTTGQTTKTTQRHQRYRRTSCWTCKKARSTPGNKTYFFLSLPHPYHPHVPNGTIMAVPSSVPSSVVFHCCKAGNGPSRGRSTPPPPTVHVTVVMVGDSAVRHVDETTFTGTMRPWTATSTDRDGTTTGTWHTTVQGGDGDDDT